MVLGAYYGAHDNEPIAGLGASDQFAVQTLQELVQGLIPGVPALSPLGVFAPWAKQDGAIDWVSAPPDHNQLIYPLTDQHVAAVKAATFGHELPMLAVLTANPMTLAKAEAAFDNTAYRFSGVEAIYSLDDKKPVPTIYFLYLGEVRDPGDPGGGKSAVSTAAQLLGGKLVSALPIPRTGTERSHPAVSFNLALSAQVSPASPLPANVVPAAPTGRAPSKWWILPVVGGLAAAGGYYWWKGRRKATG